MSVKCGRFKKSKRAWLDTFIMDMNTWPDNSVKLFKCILRFMCEMYPINQQGCIVQRLVYYHIQVNWNYVSLNDSSNRKILLLWINFRVNRLWLCLFWNGGGSPTLKKAGDCWSFFKVGDPVYGCLPERVPTFVPLQVYNRYPIWIRCLHMKRYLSWCLFMFVPFRIG